MRRIRLEEEWIGRRNRVHSSSNKLIDAEGIRTSRMTKTHPAITIINIIIAIAAVDIVVNWKGIAAATAMDVGIRRRSNGGDIRPRNRRNSKLGIQSSS